MTNETMSSRTRLMVRLSRETLAFAVVEPDNAANPVSYHPYAVRNGISMAANLREAFRTSDVLGRSYYRVQAVVNAPVLMVPVDIYHESERETLYFHSFPARDQQTVVANVLPDLNSVALFGVNKDLKLVIDDHFPQATFLNCMEPVWRHLHQRSYTGVRNKLYAYFHDARLELFSFQQNRFKFCNSFDVTRRPDALYFILYVWNQLTLKADQDELHIVGDAPERDLLMDDLRRFLKRAYLINPTGDFNRSPVTQIEGMPYDLMTLIVKGR